MRHGIAETFATTDADRQLTEQGRQLVEAKASALLPLFSEVDCVIHSPYQRAYETAQICLKEIETTKVLSSDLWVPEAKPQAAIQSLEPYSDKTVLVVTHLPIIAYVEALLCDGGVQYPRSFNCAEIAELTLDWPAAGLGHRVNRYN